MENRENSIIIPTLHLNGSGFNNLYEQYSVAISALRNARAKLPAPHGRDYYVIEGAYDKARRQFEAQVAVLDQLEMEMTAILCGIEKQDRLRNKR